MIWSIVFVVVFLGLVGVAVWAGSDGETSGKAGDSVGASSVGWTGGDGGGGHGG